MQSRRSGSGTSKPTTVTGCPAPSAPWQALQAASQTCAPVRGGASAARASTVATSTIATAASDTRK